jgi:predicted transposase YbfD/YdcC
MRMADTSFAFWNHFCTLRDPRVRGRCAHRLLDIVCIAVCAVVAGADDWTMVAAFGQRRLDWLRRFLPLPNGAPSHDTFERLFARLDPQAFARCFLRWTQSLGAALGLKQVAVDGKSLCGSASPAAGLRALHLVSAWATENQLALGQLAVEAKSNEITAIPQLLALLQLQGALVTLDAMGCQKDIAGHIVAQGGDYLLVVKGNQGHLLEDMQQALGQALESDTAAQETVATEDHGHGRVERRTCTVVYDTEGIRDRALWPQLRVLGMCTSERTVGGETTSEVRYFIGSRRAGAAFYLEGLRNHWGIENGLHWQLDVTFGEDDSQIRQRTAAENFAVLRRIALNYIKRKSRKQSVKNTRYHAALDVKVLEEILQQP